MLWQFLLASVIGVTSTIHAGVLNLSGTFLYQTSVSNQKCSVKEDNRQRRKGEYTETGYGNTGAKYCTCLLDSRPLWQIRIKWNIGWHRHFSPSKSFAVITVTAMLHIIAVWAMTLLHDREEEKKSEEEDGNRDWQM